MVTFTLTNFEHQNKHKQPTLRCISATSVGTLIPKELNDLFPQRMPRFLIFMRVIISLVECGTDFGWQSNYLPEAKHYGKSWDLSLICQAFFFPSNRPLSSLSFSQTVALTLTVTFTNPKANIIIWFVEFGRVVLPDRRSTGQKNTHIPLEEKDWVVIGQ